MRRTLFDDDHEAFRDSVRRFVTDKVVPVFGEWEAAGVLPREFFADIAALGVTGLGVPEEYGGTGIDDYRYNVVVQEEAARAAVTLGTLRTQVDVILPYFVHLADPAQKARWLPGIAAGTTLTAIALTEPGTGSDLAGVRTRARRDGDRYILDGAKTFITGGLLADLVIVLARTGEDPDDRRGGLTLLVVEGDAPGFARGRTLDKIGLRAQDTVELSFSDVRVPVSNRLGEEGRAFEYLARNLAQERLAIAVGATAQARAAVDLTIGYAHDRRVFGRELAAFQNTKFEIAAVATEVEAAQSLLDRAVAALVAGELSPADAAMVKLFCTEAQGRVTDRCLQVFGGYGYVREYPIARLFADARVTRIYGGTSEVMKSIISKSLGL
ncbi:MAG: acyl-CoA dehydrogenase family protein [Pseudonocardia sp.]|uniref:acyl-CoA dehydrogenase family protein n=1 Tax=unclassified Pseudonocardia TaxID=2619320 RepID=UPI00086EC63B|nr:MULTISPECIES: acyl-CoA dehydrogenase family protein [unclassified Pseudonocardia]MBN9110465.1 acyl-CoA dehydrogenase family protein [Pseudonocardia sp.]ODU29786.1 MAG: acyl-CoA dehydrogenase [Pseudonocardia sp. SCN 72-51]ODV03455.1 MAG: acyl-CoA dehydrogenase [Pseudonocardia sp. SCN 73-27]